MFSTNQFRVSTALFVSSLLVAAAGCSVAAREPANPDAPIAQLSASPAATSLNIATWKVFPADGDFRIVGVGTDGSTQAEVVAHPMSENEVEVQARLPEVGTFRLNREGVLTTGGSEYLQRLATVLHADLGSATQSITGAPATANGDIGSVSSALSPAAQGQFHLGWSFFGSGGRLWEGPQFCPARAAYQAYAVNGALCYVEQWYDLGSSTDCRIWVSFSNPGWHEDTCYWFVYQNP